LNNLNNLNNNKQVQHIGTPVLSPRAMRQAAEQFSEAQLHMLWRSCRFAYVSAETLAVASSIPGIPTQLLLDGLVGHALLRDSLHEQYQTFIRDKPYAERFRARTPVRAVVPSSSGSKAGDMAHELSSHKRLTFMWSGRRASEMALNASKRKVTRTGQGLWCGVLGSLALPLNGRWRWSIEICCIGQGSWGPCIGVALDSVKVDTGSNTQNAAGKYLYACKSGHIIGADGAKKVMKAKEGDVIHVLVDGDTRTIRLCKGNKLLGVLCSNWNTTTVLYPYVEMNGLGMSVALV
jgi:hypothetical protein